MNKYKVQQQGQVLLFVIVVMTVAISIGVAVSSRTLASLSRVTRQDTASKAQAAAESGIENILKKSETDLESMATQNQTSDGGVETSGNINTKYSVKIETYTNNASNNSLEYLINTGEVVEVKLNGYNKLLYLCWDGPATISYLIYDKSSIKEKRIVYSGSPTESPTDILIADQISSTTTSCGKQYPFTVPSTSTYGAEGMKIKSIAGNITVRVTPDSGARFPGQGYKLTSNGFLETEGKLTSTKRIVVYRTFPYSMGAFDNAIYTETGL